MKDVFHWMACRVDLFTTWLTMLDIKRKIKKEYHAELRELDKTKNLSTRQGRRKYENDRNKITAKHAKRLIALAQTYEKLKCDTLGWEV